MKNIIKTGRNYSYLIILLAVNVFFAATKARAQTILTRDTNVYLVIKFEDYFKDDTVSIKIDNEKIADHMILTSSTQGLTKLRVDVFASGPGQFRARIAADTMRVIKWENDNTDLDVEVRVNSVIRKYRFSSKKGIYVGFNKKANGKLLVDQRFVPKQYE